jgi:hypothetical protein
MGVVEEFPFDTGDSADPACRCGCALWDHLGGDDGACACGCPEYRAGPAGPQAGPQAAAGDQAVA